MEQFIRYKVFLLMKHVGWSLDKAQYTQSKLDNWAGKTAALLCIPAFLFGVGVSVFSWKSGIPDILALLATAVFAVALPIVCGVHVATRYEAIRKYSKRIPYALVHPFNDMIQARNTFATLLKDIKVQFITSKYVFLVKPYLGADMQFHCEQFDKAVMDDNVDKAAYHFFSLYTYCGEAENKISSKNFFHKQREMLIAEKELLDELLNYSSAQHLPEAQEAMYMEEGEGKFNF